MPHANVMFDDNTLAALYRYSTVCLATGEMQAHRNTCVIKMKQSCTEPFVSDLRFYLSCACMNYIKILEFIIMVIFLMLHCVSTLQILVLIVEHSV